MKQGDAGADLLCDLRDTNAKLVIATLRSKDLAEEAAQAEALFNALPDILARFDRDLRIVYLNAAALRITRRSRADFIGKTATQIGIPEDIVDECRALLDDAFANGVSAEKAFTFELREGPRVFHVRTLPETDSSGTIVSVVAIARDVTESEMYRAARADADRLRRMQVVSEAFSAAPTPRDVARVLATQAREALRAAAALVMFVDDDKKNLTLAASLGYPPEVSDKWSALPLDADIPLADAARTREALFFGTHDAVIARYPELARERHGDDEALAAVPLTFNGHTFGAVALVFRSPQQFADADRAFIVNLARHCAQAIDRARLLESERAAREEAEAANQLKDEFLATMSHELRTPLNAVMGWATLLRTKMTDAETQRGLEAIERNARVQARLVEDVLDVSRITSGKLKLDLVTVEVASIVSSAVEIIRPAAYAKNVGIYLVVEDVCMIWGDSARLQQVVWNLVSNAVKFTPSQGRVDVDVRQSGENAVIEVRDTGVGIPPEFLPHVFDRFRQLDGSTSRRQGGLGLGLSIVTNLVELHGGSVTAESEGEGRGATFRVELPAMHLRRTATPLPDRPSTARTQSVAAAAKDLEGVRILVVDDDEDGREIFCAAFEQCGAETTSATSAESAIRRLGSERFDVLVCDIGMPDMDGYTLMRRLRTLPESSGGRTPAIAVTGFARGEDMRLAFDAGFQKHLAKPVDLGTLIQLVAELAGRVP